jgi:hypothetical protein
MGNPFASVNAHTLQSDWDGRPAYRVRYEDFTMIAKRVTWGVLL